VLLRSCDSPIFRGGKVKVVSGYAISAVELTVFG